MESALKKLTMSRRDARCDWHQLYNLAPQLVLDPLLCDWFSFANLTLGADSWRPFCSHIWAPKSRPSHPVSLPTHYVGFSQIISDKMPTTNTERTPSIDTPLYDGWRTHRTTTTTNNMNREAYSHPLGHGTAANTGGTLATTTPPGDPNTWRRRSHSSTTMTPTNPDPPAYRSGSVHPEGTSMANPDPDTSAGWRRRYTTGTTTRTTHTHRSVHESHNGQFDSGSKKSSGPPDHGSHHRTQGHELGERKPKILTKPTPSSKEALAARNRSARERKGSQSTSSTDSVEVTVVGRGDHFNSLTDKERPPNTTTIASGQAQAHA